MKHAWKRIALRTIPVVLAATAALVTAASAQDAQAPKSDRWLHVRVENVEAKGEMVRVNVPLDLAEKVLPTINNERLQKGKLRLEEAAVNGVDLRGVLEAMRPSKDGEYATVQAHDGDVRLFKKGDYLEAHIQKKRREAENAHVEIRVPLKVVDALLSAGGNELDLAAAVHTLSAFGDTELAVIKDQKSTVRIWMDSKSSD